MIGNRYPWGRRGFSILEQGEINRQTLELDVHEWLVCFPDGRLLASFDSLAAARRAIDEQEAQP